jgi:PAS domain S-box-containing protein
LYDTGHGGGIMAADKSKIPGGPGVKAPKLDLRRKGPRKAEPPRKKEVPGKKGVPEAEVKEKIPGVKKKKKSRLPGPFRRIGSLFGAIIERVSGFLKILGTLAKFALSIARTREFSIVAVLFFAYITGLILWTIYLNVFVYVLPGVLASAVIYRILLKISEEQKMIQKERDRLKLLEDRSRVLLDNALDCVFTLDLQGNITSFNRKAERVTGYLKKDVIGQSFGMFLPQEGIKDFFSKLRRAITTGTVPLYELDINTIYGRRSFEMNLTAIKSRNKIIGVQGIGKDTTDRNRLQKELKMATSDLERWSKRTVKKEMTILEMKNQIKTIKRELEAYSTRNN